MAIETGQERATSAPTAAQPGRLGYVDGLRALAALEVMAGHLGETLWPTSDLHVGSPWRQLFTAFSYGHPAVAVFIVLSGYSLMLPVVRRGGRLSAAYGSTLGFYWRRARRILPPYYAAMALSLALIWLAIGRPTGSIWDVSLPATWQNVWQHLLLLQDFSPGGGNYTINYVFWSIALECQIYLLFPLYILLWRRYHPLMCVFIATALGFTLTGVLLYTWIGHLPTYAVTAVAPQFLGLFAMGMFAASLTHGPLASSLPWRRVAALHIWDALAVGGLMVMVIYTPAVSFAITDYAIGLGALAVLVTADRTNKHLRAALEWRPLVWIGGFSYSLYLIHAPLIQVLWQYVLRPLGLSDTTTYLLLLLVGGPLIVLAAWGFWWLCERPFLNSRRSAARAPSAPDGMVSGRL